MSERLKRSSNFAKECGPVPDDKSPTRIHLRTLLTSMMHSLRILRGHVDATMEVDSPEKLTHLLNTIRGWPTKVRKDYDAIAGVLFGLISELLGTNHATPKHVRGSSSRGSSGQKPRKRR